MATAPNLKVVATFVVVVGLVAACGADVVAVTDAAGDSETDATLPEVAGAARVLDEQEVALLPVVDFLPLPVADDPDASIRAGAAANYIECQHGVSQGGWSMDFGPSSSAPDPVGALDNFVNDELFVLPRQGYMAIGQGRGRRLFTHSVGGSAKVSVVVADSAEIPLGVESGWVIETFAACDPAEFDPSTDSDFSFDIWLDAEGNRVPTSVVVSSGGPEHCDWGSVTFLSVEGRQYVADPNGVLGDIGAVTRFDDDIDLPSDVMNTGYRRDDRQIWLSEDQAIAYVVVGDRVEAWPSAEEAFGCD